MPNTLDNLQKAAYKLHPTITEPGLTIPAQKTKLVVFKGREPVRSKFVIGSKITEKVNSVNYIGILYITNKKLTLIN